VLNKLTDFHEYLHEHCIIYHTTWHNMISTNW